MASAAAAPMPRLPPVMTTILPANEAMSVSPENACADLGATTCAGKFRQ
jgi:hypothetical protein